MRTMLWIYLLCSISLAALPWGTLPMKDNQLQVSAVALSEEMIAVGLVRNGVRILDRKTHKADSLHLVEFGTKQRIYDLAWWRSWLLIASENGLTVWDSRRKVVVVHLASNKLSFNGPGAFSLAVRGSDLWIGGLGIVAQVNLEQKKLQSSWKIPGNAGRAQSLLALGSALFVGTEGRGVQVLDLGRGSWKSYDRFDGLPANQVTGMELVGTRVIVGTAQGLGRIELPTQSASIIDSNIVVTYMTQANGTLLMTTLDGLWAMDGATLQLKKVDVQKDPELQGDLGIWGRDLVTGTDSKGVIRIEWQAGVLGEKHPVIMPQGILFTIHPEKLTNQEKISVRIWYPERATAEVTLETIPGTSSEERLVRLPADAVGHFVLEIAVFRGKEMLERKTYQVYRDRTPPMLEMEGIPEFTRDSVLKVRGKVLEQGVPIITVEPLGAKVRVDTAGIMEASIALKAGLNSWEIVVKDPSGNELRYPMQIILDRDAPKLKWKGPDTISAAQGNWKIPMIEANVRSASIEPAGSSLIATADTMILLTLQGLKEGENSFVIAIEDAAGNTTKLPIKVYYLDERSRIVQSVSPKPEPVVVTKTDTVFQCTASVAKPEIPPPVPEPCPEVVPQVQVAAVHYIRYRMRYGETLRSLADKFYGNRELYIVIAEQNKIMDPEEWYKIPVGKIIWIPIWQNFDYGKISTEKAIRQFKTKGKK